MSGQYDDFSREDLIQALHTSEDEIQDLHQQLAHSRRRSTAGAEDASAAIEIAELSEQVEEAQGKIVKYTQEISKLKESLTESNANLKIAQDERSDLNVKLREAAKRIDTLENEIVFATQKSQTAEQQTKEASKQKSETVKETKRLFEENDHLREENKHLEDIVKQLEDHHNIVEGLLVKQADEKEALELKHDQHALATEDLQNQMVQLEHQLDQANEKLQLSQDSENDLRSKIDALQREHREKENKSSENTRKLQGEISGLKKDIAVLKDSTLVGEKQRELDRERSENHDNIGLIDGLHRELEAAVHERDQLSQRILDMEKDLDQLVADKVAAERQQGKITERNLHIATQRLKDETEKIQELEDEKKSLVVEIDDLTNWKSIYEAGHGLQAHARTQKKLVDDNRRLSVALEQMTAKLGMLMDSNGLLHQAFDRLKRETGKPDSFSYPEYELQEEMRSESARLKAELGETEEQLTALEEENIRLRKTLKNQAGAVGEAGFKYAGMTADQLMKVNEFAASLRDGKTDLPLNDRSKDLLQQNRKLREEVQVRSLQVERYERELGTAASGAALSSGAAVAATIQVPADEGSKNALNNVHGELFGLRNDMQQLMNENAKLRDHVTNQQGELIFHLQQQQAAARSRKGSTIDAKDSKSVANAHAGEDHDIVAVLVANNEHLHEQLTHMKKSAAASNKELKNDVKNSTIQSVPEHQEAHTGAYQSLYASSSRPPAGLRKSGVKIPVTQLGASGQFVGGYMVPATPTGSQLHTRTVSAMNLPPEEWADEVRHLNAQLVESLEQLYEREQELEDQQVFISAQEDSMVAIKQQLATLYFDFAHRSDAWEKREKEYKSDSTALRTERDDLKLRLKRTQETLDILQKEDKASIEAKILELNRKVIIYEVNEAVLSRKFVSQSEHLILEQQTRQRLESDFVEMETALKKRILSLEQFKAVVGSRLGKLQGRLDTSVPQEDYLALQAELDNLREDHLVTLQREVEMKIYALKSQDLARELRGVKVTKASLEADLIAVRASVASLTKQIEHEKELTKKATKASESSAAHANLVSEMARHRGESGRLEVELEASTKRCELLQEQLTNALKEADGLTERSQELVKREENAAAREGEARKVALDLKLKFEGGLTRLDAETLRTDLERAKSALEDAVRDATRSRELAEIASNQAQTLGSFKQQHTEELQDLRQFCSKLESRGDDELLIGRLQRQLMSTKTSYKAFTRKYQVLRGNVRQREMALRVLETRLDQREAATLDQQEKHRLELAAMKKAIRQITNLALAMDTKEQKAPGNQSPDGQDQSALIRAAKAKFRGSSSLKTIGEKLLTMSNKVNDLSGLATDAVNRAKDAEDRARTLDGDVEDLHAEKDILQRKCQDLEAIAKGKEKATAIASRLVALSDELRLNKLSSQQAKREVTVLKKDKQHLQSIITSLHVDVEDLEHSKLLLETKNHLRHIDAPERASADGGDPLDDIGLHTFKEHSARVLSQSADSPASLRTQLVGNDGKVINYVEGKLVTEIAESADLGPASLSSDEIITRMQQLNTDLAISRREASESKLMVSQLGDQLVEARALLDERHSQIAYCERVFHDEGLPSLFGQPIGTANRQGEGKKYKLLQEDQEKLQIAATATISSMRSLLEEKNRSLEKAEAKIDELQRLRRVKSAADKHADELIQWLDATDDGFGRKKKVPLGGEGDPTAVHAKLLTQIEQADELLLQKEKTINQLEVKLAQQSNQRERAEIRCGTALTEMEAMKKDMMTLVGQLKASDEQLTHLNAIVASTTGLPVPMPTAPPTNLDMLSAPARAKFDKKISDLQKLLKGKDEKIKSYRDIIIKLKEEFVKSEEDQAVAAVSGPRPTASAAVSGNNIVISSDELRELRSQISMLRDGLRQAKDDLEKARTGRDKLVEARKSAQDEADRMESQLGRAEAQAAAAQDALTRTRKEFEETKRKEVRLREKLREMLEKDKGGGGEEGEGTVRGRKGGLGGADMRGLEEETKVLRAQNIALRQALESAEMASQGTPATGPATGPSDESKGGPRGDEGGTETGASSSPSRKATVMKASGTTTYVSRGKGASGVGAGSKGHVLGTGDDIGSQKGGPTDEYRQQMTARWENEKKLQKRVTTLEKRLQEKLEENEALQQQLAKARDTAQSALATKDEMQRKVHASARLTHEARKLTVEDLAAIEDANEKVFVLEEENTRLRRQIEVEFPNEINSLRHQVSSLRSRELELSNELEESEERRKRAAAVPASSGGGRSLRESEEKFMLEERLKTDLERARRQRLDLEAALLDRDAKAMESRFDMMARDEEVARLRRRVKELESAYRTAQASMQTARSGTGAGGGGPSEGSLASGRRGVAKPAWGPDTASGGASSAATKLSKREHELEGVVEALKRVVEKLKGENDRLRRGGVQEEDRRLAEAQKRATVEKKRAEKLDAELKVAQAKAKAGEENSQKVVQRTQQITTLRRQMKTKDEEVAGMKEQVEALLSEREKLNRKVADTESRAKQAEVSAQLAAVQAAREKVSGTAGVEGDAGGGGPSARHALEASQSTQRGANPNTSAYPNPKEAAAMATENDKLRREVVELRKRTAEAAVQNEALKAQLADARREARSLSSSVGGAGVTGVGVGVGVGVGGGGPSKEIAAMDTAGLRAKLQQLTDENAKLKRELSAFDLDFFEEIENLKYAHAEAVRKLRVHEAAAPPRR